MNYFILLAGFAGGAIRGLVGYIKYQYAYKHVTFRLDYFFFMVFISGIVGLAAGWVAKGIVETLGTAAINEFYAFIAGYAGGDFIENIYKTITKKPSLYNLPEIKTK